MNIRTTLIASSVIAASFISGTANAAYTYYAFTDLGTLGGTSSYATGINNVGQVVGKSLTAGNAATHAVVWNGTTATDLGGASPNSYANAINNAGQVVGQVINGGGPYGYVQTQSYAAIWNGPTATLIGVSTSVASSVNNVGQVAGYAYILGSNGYNPHGTIWNGTTPTYFDKNSDFTDINDNGQMVGTLNGRAAVWNGATATTLSMLDGTISNSALGINNVGQVVGSTGFQIHFDYSDQVGYIDHATLWNGTIATDLGTLAGGYSSSARAINNLGQVVGYSQTAGTNHATLWDGTTIIDLNSLLAASEVSAGWVLNSANDINDNGWIVGGATNSKTGESHAYLMAMTTSLTPVSEVPGVPEPETYAMMLVGLGLVGSVAARRRKQAGV